MFALPAGSAYSGSIYLIIENRGNRLTENQKETGIIWIENCMDLGSGLASLINAYILITWYPDIVAAPLGR